MVGFPEIVDFQKSFKTSQGLSSYSSWGKWVLELRELSKRLSGQQQNVDFDYVFGFYLGIDPSPCWL